MRHAFNLQHYGYGELNLGGAGVIIGDVGIEYKNELFYGDQVKYRGSG